MAKINNARILFDSKDLTTFFNTVSVNTTIDELPSTTFHPGDTIGNKTKQPGLFDSKITGGGFVEWQMAADGTYSLAQFLQMKLALVNKLVTVAESGGDFGKVSFFGRFMHIEYNPLQGATDALQEFTFNAVQTGGPNLVNNGRVLEPGLVLRPTFAGAAVAVPAALAGQKIWGGIHVIGSNPGSGIVKIQSAPTSGFTSPKDVIVFTFDDVGSEIKSANGPNSDTFYRVQATMTGATFKIFVSVGVV